MDKPAFVLLWLLVFTIPWTNMLIFGPAGTVARVLGVVTFAVGAVTVLGTGRLRPVKGIHVAMLVFVLWAALTFYWSLAPERTLGRCVTHVRLIAMVWVVWQFSPTVYRTRCLMQAFVLGAFVMIAATFLQRMSVDQPLTMRFAAPGFDENAEGLMLALGIPVAWHLSTVRRGPGVWLNRLYIPLAMIAILLTASRTGFAVAVVGLLIIPWTVGAVSQRARIATILAMTAVIFGVYSLVPSTSWDRIATTPDQIATKDLSGRMEIWGAGLTVAADHAVVGVGAGAYSVAVEPVYGLGAEAHNSYLSVLVENGVVGLTLFCAILLWLLLLALRMPSAERKVWLLVLVVWMVGVFFLTSESHHKTWLLFGLLAANAYAVDSPMEDTLVAGATPDMKSEMSMTMKDRVGYGA